MTNTKTKKSYIYFIEDTNYKTIKIGKATNPKTRLNELQVGNPSHLELLAACEVELKNAKLAEQELHERFEPFRVRGEWFKATQYMRDLIDWMKDKKADSMFYFEKDWVPDKIEDLTSELARYLVEQWKYGNVQIIKELHFDLKNILETGHK